jgi:predicted transcriptional regulator
MRKHPVSIALSNRILQKIDQEAAKQKRSRSSWLENHLEDFFFKRERAEQETEIDIKTG